MKAMLVIPENANSNFQTYSYGCRKVWMRLETGGTPRNIYLYPDTFNDINGTYINVIPALTKKFGDYKFILDGRIHWVFKEFLDFDFKLESKLFDIEI